MASLGQMGGEDLPAFLNRTKGLVVLMAAVMQVGKGVILVVHVCLWEAGNDFGWN